MKRWVIQRHYIIAHLHIISVTSDLSHFGSPFININFPSAGIAIWTANEQVRHATADRLGLILDVDWVLKFEVSIHINRSVLA